MSDPITPPQEQIPQVGVSVQTPPVIDPSIASPHPLDKLPELPSETKWYENKVVIVCIIVSVVGLTALLIAGLFKLEALIMTAYIGAYGTVGTTAVASVGADSVGRKVVYGIAAATKSPETQALPTTS